MRGPRACMDDDGMTRRIPTAPAGLHAARMTTAKPGEPVTEEQARGEGTAAQPTRPPARVERARDEVQRSTVEKSPESALRSEAEHWGPGDDEIAAVQRPPSDS
jgi:hypothetical protein